MTTHCAKELAPYIRALSKTAGVIHGPKFEEIAALLDRLAAIESAVPSAVAEIEREAEHTEAEYRNFRRFSSTRGPLAISHRATLLALVKRQAGELKISADYAALREHDLAHCRDVEIPHYIAERDTARSEVTRLTAEREPPRIEKPIEPGWYWSKSTDTDGDWYILRLFSSGAGLVVRNWGTLDDYARRFAPIEWRGPIKEPLPAPPEVKP